MESRFKTWRGGQRTTRGEPGEEAAGHVSERSTCREKGWDCIARATGMSGRRDHLRNKIK